MCSCGLLPSEPNNLMAYVVVLSSLKCCMDILVVPYFVLVNLGCASI